MKISWCKLALCWICALSIVYVTCTSKSKSRHPPLIHQYCGSCHLTPEPSSLPSEVWKSSVLPKMSEYFKWAQNSKYPYANKAFYNKLGSTAMDDNTWKAILDYYVNHGLDQPVMLDSLVAPYQSFFEEEIVHLSSIPSTSAISIDEEGKIWLANLEGLFGLNDSLEIIDSLNLEQQVTHIVPAKENEFFLLGTSSIDPNDQPNGSLTMINLKLRTMSTVLSGLRRPVYLYPKEDDYLISEFGFHQGGLLHYKADDESKVLIHNLPGTYRIREMNLSKDDPQIVYSIGQGMEGLYRLKYDGASYSNQPILRFPPEYGLSDFDVHDFNNDGLDDLIIVNGDNADYSIVTKGYHGVRIYQNLGNFEFREIYSHAIHGPTQVRFLDINGDDWMDFIVSAYFPLRKAESILLFMASDSSMTQFHKYGVESSHLGDWMVMHVGDFEGDGDEDILLGGYSLGPKENSTDNMSNQVDLLLLRNR